MAANREAIYSALWDLVTADPRIGAVFRTLSRYEIHFDQVDPNNMPALFLYQTGEDWLRPGKGIPPKRTLRSHFVCYTNTTAPEQLPSTAINTLMDVLDAVLTPYDGSVVTLGGLIEHVYIEGEVVMAEGLLQPKSIIIVPITMLVP